MAVKKMYLFPGGFLTLDRSILLTGIDIGKKIQAPVFSALIFHEQGVILIDTGLNPDGLQDPEQAWGPRAKIVQPRITAADDIRYRLKELGLKPNDVKMVILTHMHWDHTGGLRFFTHCPVLVQKAEHRFAYQPDSFVAAQYMQNHLAFPVNFRLLEGDQVILPGVSVIKTPGHTPGHQSILVQLPSGTTYILAGDTISIEDNLNLKIPGCNTWSAQQSFDSICRLEHLSHLLKAEIIPSHDLERFGELKKSPNYYE
jgi:N-acyl homoserine lactone hydrolase